MISSEPPRAGNRLSRRTKLLLLIAFTLVLFVLMVLVAELAVRIRATVKYGSTATAEDLYTTDERIGLRVAKAGLDTGRITTNRLGFRGPEIQVPKPANAVRLAFLGASTTWCAEVSGDDLTWPSIVTERLRELRPDRHWDYVNGGVPGYTVESSMLNLQHRIAALEPDAIVIYHATNDLSGELREIAFAQGLLESPSFKPMAWPARYSLLWELAEKNLRILFAQRAAAANASRLRLNTEQLGMQFRDDLTSLVREAQKHAPIVAVATFATQLRQGQSSAQMRKASESAMFYMPFMTPKSLTAAYDQYNSIIRQVARETGALLIDDLEKIPGTPQYFTDTVHFTDEGSRAMAERVLEALRHSSWNENSPAA